MPAKDVFYTGLGGYDIQFDSANLADGQQLYVFSDSAFTSTDTSDVNRRAYVGIKNNSGVYEFRLYDTSMSELEQYDGSTDLTELGLVRVIAHNEFISIYINKRWIHTFFLDYVYHEEIPHVGLKVSADTLTVENMVLRELSDWRNTLFVDVDSTSMNAISSVLSQRPVDEYSDYRGYLNYAYDPTRSTFYLEQVHRHNIDYGEQRGASDGMLYSEDAATAIDTEFLNDVGFVTRIYRYPDIEAGSVQAVRHMQRLGRQQTQIHDTLARFHPQLELNDIAAVYHELSGTGTWLRKSFIVERIGVTIDPQMVQMNIKGRDIGDVGT